MNMNDGTNHDMAPPMELDLIDFFIFLFYTFGVMFFSLLCLVMMYVIVKNIIMRLFGLVVANSGDGSSTDHTRTISLLDPRYVDQRLNDQTHGSRGQRYDLTKYYDDPQDVELELEKLPTEEQFYYKQGEEYMKHNPPFLLLNDNDFDPIMTEQTMTYIEEEGAGAWEFQPDQNLPNDTILVDNKTDLRFLNYGYEASIMTTLPIPYKNRVYYYECKIYEMNTADKNQEEVDTADENLQTSMNEDEVISIGFASNPYPSFRLPGKHHHSVAYESNGGRRMNSSFPLSPELQHLLPKIQKGDVMGIGYRVRSGTVFFTHNGKKVKEVEVGGHIRKWRLKYLYPIVGANIPCRVSCNFGTSGFVFVEANVKKWRFASMNGLKMPPPAYGNVGSDEILEEGHSNVTEGSIYMANRGSFSGGQTSKNSGNLSAEHLRLLDDDRDDAEGEMANQYHDYEAENSDSNASDMTNEDTDNDADELDPPPPDFNFSNPVPTLQNDAISLNTLAPQNPPEYFSDLERN